MTEIPNIVIEACCHLLAICGDCGHELQWAVDRQHIDQGRLDELHAAIARHECKVTKP